MHSPGAPDGAVWFGEGGFGGEGEGRDIAHGFDPRRWGAGSGESAFLVGGGLGLASGVVAVVAVRNGRLVEVVRVVLVAEAPRRAGTV